jgi:hypothetical protein
LHTLLRKTSTFCNLWYLFSRFMRRLSGRSTRPTQSQLSLCLSLCVFPQSPVSPSQVKDLLTLRQVFVMI